MNDTDLRESLSSDNEPSERLREHLRDDDSAAEPVSEEALVDADTIGSALSEGASHE